MCRYALFLLSQSHLMEQLTCVQVSSRSSQSFIQMERSMSTAFETMVGENLLIASQKGRQLAIEQGNYHNGIPAITVMVDPGWSKHSHKRTYVQCQFRCWGDIWFGN